MDNEQSLRKTNGYFIPSMAAYKPNTNVVDQQLKGRKNKPAKFAPTNNYGTVDATNVAPGYNYVSPVSISSYAPAVTDWLNLMRNFLNGKVQ